MSALRLSNRRVAKNAVSQILAFLLSGVTKAVVAVFIARTLGPEGLGHFMIAWTIASMLSYFAPMGLDYRLIRELNSDEGSQEVGSSMLLACLTGLVFASILALLPGFLGAGVALRGPLLAGGLFVALSAPVLIFRGVFHARERMELEAFTLIFEGVVGLGAVAAVLSAGGGVAAAMFALAAGRLANLALSFVFYRRVCGPLSIELRPETWPALLRSSTPMGISYIIHSLMLRFDIVLLALLRGPEEIGVYSAAMILIMTSGMAAAAFNSSLFPILSRAPQRDEPELVAVFGRAWRALLVAGFSAAAVLLVLGGPLLRLLYGANFGAALPVLLSLACILPLRFANNLCGITLNATDKQGRRTLITAGVAGFNLVGNLALIPLWGMTGAVVSTIVTELLLTGLLVWAIRPLSLPLRTPLTQAWGVAAVAATAATVVPGGVIVRGAAGLVAFALSSAVLLVGESHPRSTPGRLLAFFPRQAPSREVA